jgi:hypothetical protein
MEKARGTLKRVEKLSDEEEEEDKKKKKKASLLPKSYSCPFSIPLSNMCIFPPELFPTALRLGYTTYISHRRFKTWP